MNHSYHSGNYDKYNTKNPLKRLCIKHFEEYLLNKIRFTFANGNLDVSVLDIGCGEGFISAEINRHFPDMKITAIDFDAEAVKKAQNLHGSGGGGGNIVFQRGDIYNLEFQNNSFDIVLCLEVLEHLEHPEDALKEIYRVCKKHLVISVPHEPWFCLGNLLALKNVSRFGNPADHIQHWTKKSFANFLSVQFADFAIDTSFPWIIAHVVKPEKDN
jgi:ubiquinone/menaquinone biosynthesis C-methylase UbiE